MIGASSIIVEDKLKAIFDYLPNVVGTDGEFYCPVFESGDEKALSAFFSKSEQVSNYPLIWLLQPYEENHINKRRVELKNLSLIVAVQTSPDLLNSQRMEMTFKKILYPLVDKIIDALTLANTSTFDRSYSITKFANYGNVFNESEFTDLWDAIKIELNLELNNGCLKTIKF